MIDFNIRRGPSTVLFSAPGVVNDNVVIEEGCWYLCTDTAELYLGVQVGDKLTLKKINGNNAADVPTTGGGSEPERGLIGAYINDAGELCVIFSDDTEESLGVVVGKDGEDGKDGIDGKNGVDGKDGIDGKDGKDGLTTKIKIGNDTYEHVDGIIELPEFITVNQLNNYYTKSQVEKRILEFPVSSFTNDAGYITYQAINQLFDGYATEDFVSNKIGEIEQIEKENYYTKSEVNELIPDVSEFLTEVPAEYLTEAELADRKYATESFVSEAVASVPAPDLTGYATETYVKNAIAEAELNDKEVDLTGYATKDDLKNFITEVPAEYITETELEAKGYLIEHQSLEHLAAKEHEHDEYLVKADLADYAKSADLFSRDYNDLTNKPEIPSIDGLATVDYVDEAIAKIELTPGKDGVNGQDGINGKSAYELACDNGFDGNVEQWLASLKGANGENGTPGEKGEKGDKGDAFTYEDFTEDQLASLKGEKGQDGKDGADGKNGTDGKDGTNGQSAYELWLALGNTGSEEDFINSLKGANGSQGEQGPAGPKGDKGDTGEKGEAGKDGLTTSIKVGEATYTHENGTITLPEFATVVPFTTAKFVTNPIGNFVAGDNVNGLSIAELFAKLLGLSDKNPNNDPSGIVDTIIKNQTPMYAVNVNGVVESIPYKLLTYDTTTATTKPVESGFYQIVDTNNDVIESGYQQVSSVYADMPYIIALPKALDFASNVTVQSWNDLENKWEVDNVTKNALSSDAELFESFGMGSLYGDICSEVDADMYTLWFLDVASTGIIYRFIINE